MEKNELDKAKLRKEYQKRRSRLSPPEIMQCSLQICRLITSSTRFFRAKDILLYYNFGDETRTDFLFEASQRAGKNIYYPKVYGENMGFYRVDHLSELTDGYKGIKEPFRFDQSFTDSGASMQAMIIVPGIVFGRNGYRIGYGKGFYDRFLAGYPGLWKTGICFSTQIMNECPHEEHDIPMDEIICENEIITFTGEGEARWI